MITTTDRAGYITGLRALADLLEQHDELPLPATDQIHWYLFGGHMDEATQKSEARRLVRLIGGQHRKVDTGDLYRFVSDLHGLELQVIVDRATVCERIVVATETVTKQVPDPSAPLVEVSEVVEQVEWRCRPLLADDEAVASREPVSA